MENIKTRIAQDGLLSTDDTYQKIFNTLRIFTECFVLHFEKKSKHYYNLASKKDENLRRNIKAPASAINALGTIGKAFGFLRGSTWNRSRKKKAANLIKQPFYKTPDKIKEILVKAAVSIFASYECQFINKNISHKGDVEEISIDACERCLNYYKKRNNIMDATPAAITKGIIRGKSRKAVKKLPIKTHKVKNTYAVNLFEKVGLVTLAQNGQPDNYYKKKRGSTKHGYRLLLDWESESIYRAYLLNVRYRREKPPRVTNYKYFLKPELKERFTEEILNDINKNSLRLS